MASGKKEPLKKTMGTLAEKERVGTMKLVARQIKEASRYGAQQAAVSHERGGSDRKPVHVAGADDGK